MLRLTGLTLEGFRSFAAHFSEEDLPGLPGAGRMTNRLAFGDVTVLIGPNGAGKSTVTSFFRMLNFMTTGALQEYVARSGYANSILHYGSRRTPIMRALLEFEDHQRNARDQYEFRLASAANDALIFTDEVTDCYVEGFPRPQRESLGAGHREFRLRDSAQQGNKTSEVILAALDRCRSYHFHDTSEEAKIRKSGYIEDIGYLRSEAGNLAAYLYGLKNRVESEPYYRRIENTIQLAFPQFQRFVLQPQNANKKYILLNWYSRADSDYLLGPHQISDGALRFAALTTLFLQPPAKLPALIVLDEPELGLHPEAIALLAEMIKGAAQQQTQVLVATQSPQLVNHFDLAQIRPIEHRDGRSVILELDPDAYSEWLDEYSTGELWEKNVIGGGPTMVELRVYVEGPGEYGFVREILAPHLQRFGVYAQAARMGHPGKKPSGGIRDWAGAKGAETELKRALQQSSDSYPLSVTTMVDYYGLPVDWPHRDIASNLPKPQRSSEVESGMRQAMRMLLGDDRRFERFIPYVSLHELEALVLSKPDALLVEFPGSERAVQELKADIVTASPEEVDDGPNSAPSKRIERFLPGYCVRKGAAAVNTLKAINDLDHLRTACPHFGQWLRHLESLAQSVGKGN